MEFHAKNGFLNQFNDINFTSLIILKLFFIDFKLNYYLIKNYFLIITYLIIKLNCFKPLFINLSQNFFIIHYFIVKVFNF